MRTSTGKPTKEESARIVAAKTGPCVACLVRARAGLLDFDRVSYLNDYNHAKSGNIRRGHMHGYALCRWHHMRQPGEETHLFMTTIYGPSLLDGSRLFHETYGTDDELIDLQTITIEGEF